MDDFALFVCGVVVALISGMGVITSKVFLGYYEYLQKETRQLNKTQDTSSMYKKLQEVLMTKMNKEKENSNDKIKQTV